MSVNGHWERPGCRILLMSEMKVRQTRQREIDDFRVRYFTSSGRVRFFTGNCHRTRRILVLAAIFQMHLRRIVGGRMCTVYGGLGVGGWVIYEFSAQ